MLKKVIATKPGQSRIERDLTPDEIAQRLADEAETVAEQLANEYKKNRIAAYGSVKSN